MKRQSKSIHLQLFFNGLLAVFCFLSPNFSFSQGFNGNEWIFGYCPTATSNSYLSFGKGTEPVVKELPTSIIIGSETGEVDNGAVMIDPITGQVLFFTNGGTIYNYNFDPITGVGSGINGVRDERQAVAIATLNYDPDGDRLFYVFYRSPSGQLLYSVVDMNAPGGAAVGQPPLGAVTALNQPLGFATGAIAVVKTPNSPNYLVSYDGGELVIRRIEPTQGDFTETARRSLPFTPKAIIFKESTQQLILIPSNPGEDIFLIELDTATGILGAITTVDQSGGDEEIEGADLSPDGAFLYFSRGDQLLRVPTSDLSAVPEVVPLPTTPHQIYDIRVGPDGRLYYIYQEVAGGPFLIGRVGNPDEEDLAELEIEEDPFNGVNFCGTVFPQFAPNQDINPTVSFTWDPDEPCSNNPVQLTSEITPLNYRPVSFEWTFDPPLTNEDGDPIDIDFNQEHLLIPAEATSGESVTVTLVVTFANGETSAPFTETIMLTNNDLEASFSPEQETICEPDCVDLMEYLETQQGGGAGGGPGGPGAPGGPGVGGGGGNFQYFWSNRRDEGWVAEGPNEVCLPGLYWVLVREEGSSCYAYAEFRLRVWDLEDQSNGVWHFGDGAGLDFNPDPNDPDAVPPRAISHPHNIPAGTATISDETGQILFYTDGQTVWDLNGDVMENGNDIGGSNQTSQGVIAVPVPQNPTIYYVFTTQTSGAGGNSVSFSVVDLGAENPTGAGAVTSSNNFLFSPSTEQVAALATGATNWVLFHELGNNTFRAYPLTQFGIGQPVFSSVGSRHGFGAGVGTMKFSPDGSQVAVTINDGACSRLEIFDFDVVTGRLTEYALVNVDPECTNKDIYGVEFSNDGTRVYVSYRGNGGSIEEFLIKDPEPENDTPSPCGECFRNATTRQAREDCILNSGVRNTLTSDGPFGAIQIAPNGQIYVARPGQNEITSILPGGGCAPSVYNDQGIALVPGTSMTLGLPSFARQSGSSIPEPSLEGPERLCLDPVQGAEAEFGGGGEPDIDSYFWTIVHEDGTADITRFGGAGEDFQNYIHNFQRPGLYTVTLEVARCGNPYDNFPMQVLVVAAPEITLPDDAVLCVGSPVTLTAIDGYDPAEELYDFEWSDAAGFLIGDVDSNSIEVDSEGVYTVRVSFRVPAGQDPDTFDACPTERSIFVGPAFEFDINLSQDEVCFEDVIVTFAPDTPIVGEWYFELEGVPGRTLLIEAFELELNPLLMLPGPGTYDIIFLAEDPITPGCLIEKVTEIVVHPLPMIQIEPLSDSDCIALDGSFRVTAVTDIESLTVNETGDDFLNISAGTTLPVFDNLAPGIYTLVLENAFGCTDVQTVVIQNRNAPADLRDFNVTSEDEICGPVGIEDGQIILTFPTAPTSILGVRYRIVRLGDASFVSPSGLLSSVEVNSGRFEIGVPHGEYSVELIDATGCAIPGSNVIVGRKFQVDFSVPANVVACEQFIFTPTPSTLKFELSRVSGGNIILPEADGSYVLIASDDYVLFGEDPSGNDCPRERSFRVDINPPILFDVSLPLIDCEDGISYEAELPVGVSPADVFIFWRDVDGTIVGRDPVFFPRAVGDYTLEVQPRGSTLCTPTPIPFEVEALLGSVNFTVASEPICDPLVPATIRLQGDYDQATIREWFRVSGGTATLLPEFNGADEIQVSEDGIYEVVLSDLFCELGRRRVQVRRSAGIAPDLEERYTICAIENVSVELDPGTYESYEWFLNDELVSDSPTFTPTEPGTYRLEVTDEAGCVFVEEFEVVEDCRLLVKVPDAMQPSDPFKQFVVYANAFVDNLEVAIYNRWGELIFYCETDNILPNQTVCEWDGIYRGKVVPVGTYAVVLRFTSIQQGITQTQRSALLVIE